jgi:hypothetical protein
VQGSFLADTVLIQSPDWPVEFASAGMSLENEIHFRYSCFALWSGVQEKTSLTLPMKAHKVAVNIADYGGVQTYGSAGYRFNSYWVHHFK